MQFDVVVVGAGLCGATVAGRLSEAGVRCALLEAGEDVPASLPAGWNAFTRATAPLTKVDEREWAFRGSRRPIEWMRVRAAGGRTLLWGGWMVRPDVRNLRDARAMGHEWPMSFKRLDHLVRRVEPRLSVRTARIGALVAQLRRGGIPVMPKRASVGPGGGRPLFSLDIRGTATLVPRTVALRAILDRSGRARAVECIDPVEHTVHTIEAKAVVLAASAIESARILDATPGLDLPQIGEGLHDHMYCGAIVLMRAPAPETEGGPLDRAAFLPAERCESGLGFSVEVRAPVALATLDDEDLGLLGIARADAERMSFYTVFAIGEKAPSPRRRVHFDVSKPDALGRATPVIDLPALSSDEATLARAMRARCDEIAHVLADGAGTVIPIRDPRDRLLGHEAGTCRMGTRKSGAVTDADGAVFGARGLYVADAGRMPTALDRHPSLTVAALALGTAERVLEDVR